MNILSVPGSKLATLGNIILHKSLFNAADNTNVTAYTPDIGNTFSNLVGTWAVQSGKLVPNGTVPASTQWVCVTPDLGATDVKVTAVMSTLGSSEKQIWLRCDTVASASNVIIVQIGITSVDSNGQDLNISIYSFAGGVFTSVASATAAALDVPVGSNQTVVVVLEANAITVGINGTNYITSLALPTTQTNTKYGFATAATSNPNDVKADSFQVEKTS